MRESLARAILRLGHANTNFWGSVTVTLATLAFLGGLLLWSPFLGKVAGGYGERFAERLLRQGANVEEQFGRSDGYYEVLFDEGSRRASRTAAGVSAWAIAGAQPPAARVPSLKRQRPDFLLWDFAPSTYVEFSDLTTNSFGMADREYSLQKPAGVRRIAVLGDSVGRGFGASFGKGWEALLEDRLNEEFGPALRYEILNFSVDTWFITQILDVALERTPAFEPDIYLIALSERVVDERRWSQHISQLLVTRGDLKYPFLNEITAQAGVPAGTPIARSKAKLAKFRTPAIRWALSEIKARAERDHATVIVALIPDLNQGSSYGEKFHGVYGVLAELEIPTLDVLDTFHGRPDQERYRFKNPHIAVDPHPNDEGYRLLFENLYRKLQDQPETFSRLLGRS